MLCASVFAHLWRSDPCKVMWKRVGRMLSLQQAEFSGFQGRLCAVAHPQLAQDVAEVILDGATGDVEGLADLAIGSPTRQQGQDLPLALGQLRRAAHADERRSGGAIIVGSMDAAEKEARTLCATSGCRGTCPCATPRMVVVSCSAVISLST